jgi:hypothetical protein
VSAGASAAKQDVADLSIYRGVPEIAYSSEAQIGATSKPNPPAAH